MFTALWFAVRVTPALLSLCYKVGKRLRPVQYSYNGRTAAIILPIALLVSRLAIAGFITALCLIVRVAPALLSLGWKIKKVESL